MQTVKRLPRSAPPSRLDMNDLPQDLIANVLSFTGPRESCRLAVVSSTFWSASLSDTVWDRFLPPDILSILSRTTNASDPDFASNKKDLFLRLCERPILIDGGRKSFSLDKRTGKKCYMISSRDLHIIWGDTPRYWKWVPESDSRFGEAAELVGVCWLELKGTIPTTMLSPSTLYTAYLVFRSPQGGYGFDHQPVEVSVGLSGSDKTVRSVYLDAGMVKRKERGDGSYEVELGDFFTKEGVGEGELEMYLAEVKGGNWKGGIFVEGIEIRPKEAK
ncbi:unnamed protein product [Linum tenue]|uniref:F-box domain-containing protein n=1 Tax=Linum tenue TaxID=586396 RepID=A0AAV0RV83_9ROSI|nr:unnamed protein product [Linum tenue]